MSLLEEIQHPDDVKKLNHQQLVKLADETREFIIDAVSQTGGHLGSNLGAVELTIALHSVFDFQRDKLIFDVGHQCYTHKILTGRQKGFATLRQYGGMSGFPKRSESEFDAFGAGHSSTSISAATGFAIAREKTGKKYSTVAVIGDGALTSGLALEALNHLGHLQLPAIIVLNDNEMSISPNVGAMSHYLNRVRTDPAYYRLKKDVEYLLRRVPMIGTTMAKLGDRMKLMLKYLMVQGLVFEELGFTYMGPVDGHDIQALRETFISARGAGKPVLVHVHTRKGKGYEPAESHQFNYHSAARFDKTNGNGVAKKKKNKSFTQHFGESMCKLAEKNRKIIGISAAMCDGTGLLPFSEKFPDRFVDVGICEPHAVTMAAAMACEGLIPIVAIYSTFLQRAYDQIIHDVALQKLHVIFVLDRAGLVGDDGPTHHGAYDVAFLRTIPSITIFVPRDELKLHQMMKKATELTGPVAIRYPKGEAIGIEIPDTLPPLPEAGYETLHVGHDIQIVGIGPMLQDVLTIAEELETKGISLGVIDALTAKPISEQLITHLIATNQPIITLEESTIAGGFGSALLEKLTEKAWPGQLHRAGLPDRFITHGANSCLHAEIGLDHEGLTKTILDFLQTVTGKRTNVHENKRSTIKKDS